MQMGKKRPVRCNQNADISQQWWKTIIKWQQTSGLNESFLMHSTCEKMIDGNLPIAWQYLWKTFIWQMMKTNWLNENDFMNSTHSQTVQHKLTNETIKMVTTGERELGIIENDMVIHWNRMFDIQTQW